ncbi:MAG: iron-sulfur cluster assembly protein [Prevotellaceae bacterium]|jgi:FeS assembly SUF system protein|nr:iron-sulfur cluster assembly protein [Prevotellaceae bacterium]
MIELEKKIITVLKNVYDPEIPVNIYDLGLIYEIIVDGSKAVKITMTLTAPNCPMADELVDDVYQSVKAIDEVANVAVKLTFEPAWDKSMMTEEAMLELGLL